MKIEKKTLTRVQVRYMCVHVQIYNMLYSETLVAAVSRRFQVINCKTRLIEPVQLLISGLLLQ